VEKVESAMNLKQTWLNELRDFVVDKVPSSGPYIPRPQVMYEISKATGVCFVAGQRKSDWRETIEMYFEDNPE